MRLKNTKTFAAAVAMSALYVTAGADEAARIALSIQAQPISKALMDLGEQAGLQVIVRREDIMSEGKLAPSVNGTLTVQAALELLLTDSGLTYEFLDPRTVRVSRPATGATRSLQPGALETWVAQANSGVGAAAPSVYGRDQDAAESLEEVIVTAQKRSERLQDVPISVFVLGGEELDRSTYSQVTEALRFTPGVVVSTSGDLYNNGTTFTLRGVGSAGARVSGSSTTGYYIDSVAYGFTRSSFVPGLTSVYDLERIEVLSGPQGTLYGAQSMNGVVRVLTHRAELDQYSVKTRAAVGSTEGGEMSYSGDAAFNFPLIEGKLAGRLIAGYHYDGGWIDSINLGEPLPGPCAQAVCRAGKEDNNWAKTKSARLKLRAEPIDSLSVDFSAWYVEGDSGSGNFSDDSGVQRARIEQPGVHHYSTFNLEIAKEFSAFSLSSATSYFDYKNSGILDSFVIGGTVALDTRFSANFLTQEINLTSNLSGPWRWSTGLFYRDSDETYFQRFINSGTGAITPRNDFSDESKSMAAYGEVSRQIFREDLELLVGLRYFRDEQTMTQNANVPTLPNVPAGSTFKDDFNALTPRVVLNWKPSSNTTIYASYSQGFRSGLVQQPIVKQVYPALESADPDTLTNYEIGLKGTMFEGLVTYEFAGYYIDWKDILAVLNVPAPGGVTITQSLLNGTSASGFGTTGTMAFKPLEGFEFGINATWNGLEYDANLESATTVGGPLTVVAKAGDPIGTKRQLGAFVQYRHSLNASLTGFMGADAAHNSGEKALNSPGARDGKGGTMVNARLGVEASQGWTLSAYGNNLDNSDGGAIVPAAGALEWQPRWRPRTFGLQFEYRY